MSVNLKKGQRVDLTKGNAGLSRIMVGLGWDEAEKPRKGLLATLFGSGGSTDEIDCDASVLMLNVNGKLARKEDLIYFGNLRSKCGSVIHTGDNLTGEGEGDDETILVEINKIPSNIHRLVFVVNIYDCIKRNQHFGMIRNAFIRVVNYSNNQELVKFNLSEDYAGKTAVFAGEIYRHDTEWKFAAIGEPTNDTSLKDIVRRY